MAIKFVGKAKDLAKAHGYREPHRLSVKEARVEMEKIQAQLRRLPKSAVDERMALTGQLVKLCQRMVGQ